MVADLRFAITRDGLRVAVLLGAEDYDRLMETLAVLSDRDLLADHRAAEVELAAGLAEDEEDLRRAMQEAGRLPR